MVEASSFPNWSGEAQERYYEITDRALTLRSNYVDGSIQKLVWEKLDKERSGI